MRRLKIFISIIICIGLLGGVGYAIYTAATFKSTDVSIIDSKTNKTLDISDIVKDYDKIADGEAIKLPETEEELASVGIEVPKGYMFKCWSYDAGGTKEVTQNVLIKSQSARTIYLQWEKRHYYVYMLNIKSELAKDFDFQNYGDISYYNSICINNQAHYDVVQYEGSTNLTLNEADDVGYVQTWLKWTGNGAYEVDDNGNAVYYSGMQQITESVTFVRCVMPKKYIINYKYIDENNNEQNLGQKELVFNKPEDKIIASDINYARKGYTVSSYTFKNDARSFEITNTQYMDESVLNFTGDKVSSIDCFVSYTPRKYHLQLIGYAGDEIIKTGGVTEVNYNDTNVLYYTNLYDYLNDLLNTTNEISRSFLIFKKFVYADNNLEVAEGDRMPYCHKMADGSNDEDRQLAGDEAFVIKVMYEIREYNANIFLKLKNEQTLLKTTKIRYGSGYNFDENFVTFEKALHDNINTKSYFVDEYEFNNYLVQRSEQDDIIVDSYNDLKGVPCLNAVVEDVDIVLTTNKVRFFLELVNRGVNNDFKRNIARVEMTFDSQGNVSYINPDNAEDTSFKISSITSGIYPTKYQQTDANYQFGGWLCADAKTFGDYAYVNDDYVFNKKDITDDVVAEAVWYEIEIGTTDWSWILNDDGENTITIVRYNSTRANICVPRQILNNTGVYTVTRIGNSTNSILQVNSAVRKVFIPNSVKLIASYAFADNVSGVDIRFEDGGENDLIISEFAFSASRTNNTFTGFTGISSIYLPSRLTAMQEGAFAFNTNLKNVEINSSNENYFVENVTESVGDAINGGKVIYQKDGDNRKLFAYCSKNTLTSFTIPTDVTRICSYAFTQVNGYNAGYLRNVYSEDSNSIKEIGNYAFACNSTLQTVVMRTLTNLEQLGTNIFEYSFTEKPTGSEVNPYSSCLFRYVSFDFNHLTYIPDYMFRGASNLLGFDFLNTENIINVGDYALYDVALDFAKGELSQFYTYSNIKSGFIDFAKKYYNEDFSSLTGFELKAKISEYLQSFVVLNSLHKVGYRAFDTSSYSTDSGSVLKIYVYSESTDCVLVEGTKDDPATISADAFGQIGKVKVYPFHLLTKKIMVRGSELSNLINVQKVVIKNAEVLLQSIDVVLNNLGIEFIDCEFTKGGSFNSFGIIDSDNEDMTTFDFVVRYTKDYVAGYTNAYKDYYGRDDVDRRVNHIADNVFDNLKIQDSNFKLIVAPELSSFVLNQGSLYYVYCKSLTIQNVSEVHNASFCTPTYKETNLGSGYSAVEINFIDCTFAFTISSGFRKDMFVDLKQLQRITFTNCDNIFSELFTSDGERTENTFRNNFYAGVSTIKILPSGIIDVSFVSENE